MILYSLVCDDGSHAFESWFPNSAAYDDQARRGLVTCPFCQSPRISKAIMAPAVARANEPSAAAQPAPAPAEAPTQEMAIADDDLRQLHVMARALRAKIIESSEDVGANFPAQARLMHDGLTEPRAIRGQATQQEARELVEDGVPVLPIPIIPDECN